jgi:hypothetical protein
LARDELSDVTSFARGKLVTKRSSCASGRESDFTQSSSEEKRNMHRLSSFAALAVLSLGLGTIAPAFGAPYDAPTVNVARSIPSSITLQIQAGPSGAPAGFLIDWMPKSEYDVWGWNSQYAPTYICDLYGTPLYNELPNNGSFRVGPNGIVTAEVGDMFDETGVSTNYNYELDENTEYVFRVRAKGDAAGQVSPNSATLFTATIPHTQNCTFTQGYWKNHPEAWPVGGLTLGTVPYTAAQLLLIFGQPASGNGLISLCHQLIAAKLNLAQGADPTAISATIAAADALIGGLVCPPIGGGFLAPGTTSALTDTLDDFNSGLIGPGHCAETPTQNTTWGRLKAIYR